MKPDCSLEAVIMKLKLKYFDHIIRKQDSMKKMRMSGKIEDNRKIGWQKIRWLDIITDVMKIDSQEL